MQAKIKTEPYEYFDPVFDGSYEVPIDTEYNLPDYCADTVSYTHLTLPTIA